MSEHICETKVWAKWDHTFTRCGRTAKIEHAGKWYCGIHDPVKKAQKDAERNARLDAEFEAKLAAHRLNKAAPAMLEALEALEIEATRLGNGLSAKGQGATILGMRCKAARAAIAKAKGGA